MSDLADISLVLAGCGKMGGALLEGWQKQGLQQAIIVDPHAAPIKGTILFSDVSDIPGDMVPDVLVLAVKPQVMDQVAPLYKEMVTAKTLVVSVAAGISLAQLRGWLGEAPAIIRAMPNLPALIGQGVTALAAPEETTEHAWRLAETLMKAVGVVHRLPKEDLMDAVTGVSGSGPAYLFYFIEALAEAGKQAGLPAELAMALAKETVAGSVALAMQAEENLSTLRERVTSPGGTTQAALEVLMRDTQGMRSLLQEAVAAATQRSLELQEGQ